jgi:S-adenosyl-L-methionine hydrolase (adenosine-forming)
VATRPITFLSDYGTDDEFAGVCRAVIARVAPSALVVDLTHGVRRHDVRDGAVALANSLPFAPPGVHLAVVDPGVGTARRPVAVRVAEDDRILVGPDNGLLSLAWGRFGGPVEAVDIATSQFRLEPASSTFHGRDLFAPVAAHLALGDDLGQAGTPVDVEKLNALEIPAPRIWPDRIVAHVVRTDRFGNVSLNVGHEDLAGGPLRLGEPLAVESAGERVGASFARTFEDVDPGKLMLYEDSTRTLALAVNRGSAADLLRLRRDDEVVLHPA